MAEISLEQCRTCLLKETEIISLMADHVVCDKVMSVLDLLKTCTSAEIEFDDGYPQFVCLECIHSAEKSYEFRVQCEKADSTLKSQFEKILDNKACEISTPLPDENINCDDNDDDDDDDDDDINAENYEVLEPDFQNDSDEVYLNLLQNKDEIKCEEIDLGDTTFACTVCNLIFPTGTALAKHTSSTHHPNFYQCSFCPVRFITQELLEKHIIKHNERNQVNQISPKRKRKVDYICAVCGKKYATLGSLNSHVRKHSKDQKSKLVNHDPAENPIFICHACDHHFVSAADLQMHMETLHHLKREELVVKCKYCYKSFNNNESLQEHIDTNHQKKKPLQQTKVSYKCKICFEHAKSLPDIKDHLSTHDVTSKDIFSHLSYQCTECEKDFETIYDFFTHSSSVHGGTRVEHSSSTSTGTRVVRKRPYPCTIANCDKAFPSPSALKKHMLTHESQWPKKCRYCDAVVSKWHEYMMHLNQSHDDKKTFICSQCGKKFFRERNLQSHMKTHTGERNYMCDYCGFSFQAQNNLVAHRRIHTGAKPYKCSYCPQAFAQHAGLRSHLLNHSGEKKHECPTCSKKFLRLGALRNHIKTHTGVKDYACHICGARFGASSTRKKHLLTHTGERNHVCDFCGKAFSRRSNLSVHRKIHTGETPHVCEVCGKGFIQRHVLRSHMNTHRKRGQVQSVKKTSKIDTKPEETPEDITVLVEIHNE